MNSYRLVEFQSEDCGSGREIVRIKFLYIGDSEVPSHEVVVTKKSSFIPGRGRCWESKDKLKNSRLMYVEVLNCTLKPFKKALAKAQKKITRNCVRPDCIEIINLEKLKGEFI